MSSRYELLKQQCDKAKSWKCQLRFQESYCELDEPSFVSLVSLMSPHLPEDYLFPECYVGEESETRLVMELKLAALLEGFSLVVGSKEYVPANKATSNRLVAIRLECRHFRVRRLANR